MDRNSYCNLSGNRKLETTPPPLSWGGYQSKHFWGVTYGKMTDRKEENEGMQKKEKGQHKV
jgi:hypothetical protein